MLPSGILSNVGSKNICKEMFPKKNKKKYIDQNHVLMFVTLIDILEKILTDILLNIIFPWNSL